MATYSDLVCYAFVMGVEDKLEAAYRAFSDIAYLLNRKFSSEEIASLLAEEYEYMEGPDSYPAESSSELEDEVNYGYDEPDEDEDALADAELERQSERHYYQYVEPGSY